MAKIHEELPEKNIQISRMGFAQVACPTTRSLEGLFYPNGKTISEKVVQMLKKDIDISNFNFDNNELKEFKGPFR